MFVRNLLSAALAATLVLAPVSHASAQVGAGAAVVTTAVFMDGLNDLANQVIEKARRTGDYMMGKAGIEARTAIEAFKEANSDLLNQAFGQLDEASRANFARMQLSLTQLRDGIGDATNAITDATDAAQQLSAILDIQGSRSFVIRYTPKVVYNATSPMTLISIRGANLDDSQAKLLVTGGAIDARVLGRQDLAVELPKRFLKFDATSSTLNRFTLQYASVKAGWFNRLFGIKETRQNDVLLMGLPLELGQYSFTTKVKRVVRETKQTHYSGEQFKGTNENQYQWIRPDPGWRLDLATVQVQQGHGEAGRIEGIVDEDKTEFGVKVRARLDRIRQGITRWGPGYVNWTATYTQYKDEEKVLEGPTGTGAIGWAADVVVPLDPDFHSLNLTVKTFDGVQRNHSDTAGEKLYEVHRETDRLVIRPKVPGDLGS